MSVERTGKDLVRAVAPPATSAESDKGIITDSSLLELTRGLEKEEEEKKGKTDVVKEDATAPPPTPQSGISILAHKIWIGNLDKRLSQ